MYNLSLHSHSPTNDNGGVKLGVVASKESFQEFTSLSSLTDK